MCKYKSGILPAYLLFISSLYTEGKDFTPKARANVPNILLILVDDYGWNDCGFMGSKLYETPNIDKLASKGTVFTDGYSACQVSSPSRASIMTGLYPTRHGITDWIGAKSGEEWRLNGRCNRLLPANYNKNLDTNFVTIAEALKDAGYTTFIAGKWHLGDSVTPEMQGFDINKGGYWAGSPKGGYFSPYNNPMLEDGPWGEDLPGRLAEETISFVTDMAKNDRPFFAYLSFYAVHAPVQTRRILYEKYRNKIEHQGFVQGPGFERDGGLPVRKYQDNPVYAGLIEMMDSGVGLVLDKLEELGISDETIVIFTSDNGGVVSGDGYSTSLFPLRGGKGRQWEGGIRVPYIIYDPQSGNGKKCNTPVSGIDIFPTIIDYVGLNVSDYEVDGTSLRPLLYNGAIKDRQLFWHYPHYGNQGGSPSSVVRDGKWKLIFYHETGKYELYDLETDISEEHPCEALYPSVCECMKNKLLAWMHSTNAVMPNEDIEYSYEKEKDYRERINEKIIIEQENLRLEMMQPGWLPNSDWWGSESD